MKLKLILGNGKQTSREREEQIQRRRARIRLIRNHLGEDKTKKIYLPGYRLGPIEIIEGKVYELDRGEKYVSKDLIFKKLFRT